MGDKLIQTQYAIFLLKFSASLAFMLGMASCNSRSPNTKSSCVNAQASKAAEAKIAKVLAKGLPGGKFEFDIKDTDGRTAKIGSCYVNVSYSSHLKGVLLVNNHCLSRSVGQSFPSNYRIHEYLSTEVDQQPISGYLTYKINISELSEAQRFVTNSSMTEKYLQGNTQERGYPLDILFSRASSRTNNLCKELDEKLGNQVCFRYQDLAIFEFERAPHSDSNMEAVIKKMIEGHMAQDRAKMAPSYLQDRLNLQREIRGRRFVVLLNSLKDSLNPSTDQQLLTHLLDLSTFFKLGYTASNISTLIADKSLADETIQELATEI